MPVDYHRFHFPCGGNVQSTDLINGALFSVSPIALRKDISIFWQNKRYLTVLENSKLGTLLQLMIGATCVGSVNWTSKVGQHYQKGDEQGYFPLVAPVSLRYFVQSLLDLKMTF